MKKIRLLTLFILCTFFLVPFGSFSVAQLNGYVGVEEGDEYEWRIKLDLDGVDALMYNVPALLTEIENRLSTLDLFGYESLTIPEVIENMTHTLVSKILPSGWEGMNISTLFQATYDYYITEFNSTILSGMIPSYWRSLNYSTFVDKIIDGLNSTAPLGWEDHPIPYLMQLALNELNSTLLFGLLPDGWEIMTLQELFDNLIQNAIPEARESFITSLMMDQLLSTILVTLPAGSEFQMIRDILPLAFPPEVSNMNLTALLNSTWYLFNSSFPIGWDSENVSTFIDFQVEALNTTLLPSGFDKENMSSIIEWDIDEIMDNFTISIPSGTLPLGWETMTIQELAITLIQGYKTQWTTEILPGWEMSKEMAGNMGGIPMVIGLKVVIDQIYPEMEAYSGGPRATPIDMTTFISLDMKTWMTLQEYIEFLNSTLNMAQDTPFLISPDVFLGLTQTSHIIDPSSYSDPNIALLDQAILTQCLIVATNYDWTTVTTNATIPTAGNPDAFEVLTEWNFNGVLETASLKSDGLTVVSINLHKVTEEIPGYEIMTFITVTSIAIIGIIYYMRRKLK
ncbi:MAG: hypothetical protein ACFFG0_13625 [Candidatus Thorarchaeota archaeon]